MALVEDEDDAPVSERLESVDIVASVGRVEREAQLLDGADDNFVGGIVGKEPADEGFGIGVFLDAPFLKTVELLAGLAIEVFAVNDEEAFLNSWGLP